MICEGQIVLFRFPQTDQASGKLRPALVVRELPGHYDDWLICMISSQTFQCIPEFDELILEKDPDFSLSGLKVPSVVRVSRLAVVGRSVFSGAMGIISAERLLQVKKNLSAWIVERG